MSRWDRYVLRPRVWTETSRCKTVPHIGPYNDVLRMCVDYGPVNKPCPKDHFPLPRIDQIIDSTAGCDPLSFLDAYSGYNQIRMKEEDEEHTSFITPYGVFC